MRDESLKTKPPQTPGLAALSKQLTFCEKTARRPRSIAR
jgi:hypothetical protein